MSEPGFRESGLQNCVLVLNDFCFRQVPENKMSVDCGYLDPTLWPQLPKAVPSTAAALQRMQQSADPASAQTSVWTWTGAWETLESAFHGVADNSSLQGTSSCTKCGWWHGSGPAIETGHAWCVSRKRNLLLGLESRLWGCGTWALSWAQGNCPGKSMTWSLWEGILQTAEDLKPALEPRARKMSAPLQTCAEIKQKTEALGADAWQVGGIRGWESVRGSLSWAGHTTLPHVLGRQSGC